MTLPVASSQPNPPPPQPSKALTLFRGKSARRATCVPAWARARHSLLAWLLLLLRSFSMTRASALACPQIQATTPTRRRRRCRCVGGLDRSTAVLLGERASSRGPCTPPCRRFGLCPTGGDGQEQSVPSIRLPPKRASSPPQPPVRLAGGRVDPCVCGVWCAVCAGVGKKGQPICRKMQPLLIQ
jgi:hypothetical protein